MDLQPPNLDVRTISEMAWDVTVRLVAVASLREMSLTECPLYRARAASIMVGVGQYRPRCHSIASIFASSWANHKTPSITCRSDSVLHRIGQSSLSFWGVAQIALATAGALVAKRTGAMQHE